MAVVGILALPWTGPSRQQVLQGAKTVLDPVPPLPGPDEPWSADVGFKTYHVELLFPGFRKYDEGHGAIRRTGRPQPLIAHPWHLLAIPPGQIAVLLQVVAFDLPPIGEFKDIATLPFHEERTLVRRGHMAHELRITKPTIRDDHRRGQCHATSADRRHASIQHALHPV